MAARASRPRTFQVVVAKEELLQLFQLGQLVRDRPGEAASAMVKRVCHFVSLVAVVVVVVWRCCYIAGMLPSLLML